MKKLAVIVINYGTLELSKNCVGAILLNLPHNSHIVVVDNHSPDRSGEQLEEWVASEHQGSPIEVVLSPENHGFSGGNNIGIQSVNAEYYLLINSDTVVRPGALQLMVDTLDKVEHGVGLLTPRLEFEDGTPQISCFRFHNPISEFLTAASLNLFTRVLKRFDVPVDLVDTPTYCQWSSFACIMIKKKVFDDIGLMDEGYFLYYEDTDLCRTALAGGWKTMNQPEAHVVHYRGGSAELKSNIVNKKRLPKYYYAARARYFCKFYGRLGLLAANIMWTLGATLGVVKSRLKKEPSQVCDKQFRDIWQFNISPMKRYRP